MGCCNFWWFQINHKRTVVHGKKYSTQLYSWQKCIMQPALIYVVYICKDFLNENMWLQLVTRKEFHNYIKFYILFLTSNIHLVIFPLFYSSVYADAPWKVNVLSALLSQPGSWEPSHASGQPCAPTPTGCSSWLIPRMACFNVIAWSWRALGEWYTQLWEQSDLLSISTGAQSTCPVATGPGCVLERHLKPCQTLLLSSCPWSNHSAAAPYKLLGTKDT